MDPACDPKPALLSLVGSARTIVDGDTQGVSRFYGDLLARLALQVRHTGALTRHVGYQDRAEGGRRLHFLGIEVERIAGIPEGMVGWELSQDTLTVWNSKSGTDRIVSRRPVRWQWLSPTAGGVRSVGEFEVAGRALRLSANAYVGLDVKDADTDEIRLVDYDPSWPAQFAAFADWLRGQVGPDLALRIEHYGSTAVPGMPAKPIIDVLLEVPSFPEAKRRLVPLFNVPEWEYWWYSGHMVFIRRERLGGPRTHHLHVATPGHRMWEGLVFRDYLRTHPDDASRYAALKRDLALRLCSGQGEQGRTLAAAHAQDLPDRQAGRERYTEAKTEFVEEVLRRAAGM